MPKNHTSEHVSGIFARTTWQLMKFMAVQIVLLLQRLTRVEPKLAELTIASTFCNVPDALGTVSMWNPSLGKRNGITLVELSVTFGVIGILLTIALPAIANVRESVRSISCSSKARQLVIGVHEFSAARGRMPSNHPEPWTKLVVGQFGPSMPTTNLDRLENEAFQCPSATASWVDGVQISNYAFNYELLDIRPEQIFDGTSNTLAIGEIRSSFAAGWLSGPLILKAALGSPHGERFGVVLADSSSRFLSKNIDDELLEALLTASGMEKVQLP